MYCYESLNQMQSILPQEAVNNLIINAQSKILNVCTRKPVKCLGSLNGKYIYADGTQDNGIDIEIFTSEYNGIKVTWQ